MATANRELMTKARGALTGRWETPILAYLIYIIITNVGGPVGLIVGGPMNLGAATFALNFARGKKAEIADVLAGFNNFIESIIAFLLILVYTALWSLLFVIPGIVAALSYSQTFFIMADDKKIKAVDAMKKSREMMNGYKGKLFRLGFRFTGWFLLSVLTCGIGFLWLMPYIQVTFANFYEDIK